jgi:hypothetical protein
MAGIPEDRQLTPWQYHMMSPEEQDEYERSMQALKQFIVDQERDAIRKAKERALLEEKQQYIKSMEKRISNPKSRTNWDEMEELMTNVRMHVAYLSAAFLSLSSCEFSRCVAACACVRACVCLCVCVCVAGAGSEGMGVHDG